MMEHLVDDFIEASSALKVHKRAAANIKEQIIIISKSQEHNNTKSKSRSFPWPSSSSHSPNLFQRLRALSDLPQLQSYLRQGEITNVLDSFLDACWDFAQKCDDELLQEDIETQRELYKSDREADGVNLKRLLRDCLRHADCEQLVSILTIQEISALRSAVNLELRSTSGQGVNAPVQATRVLTDFLSRLDSQLEENWRPKEIQDLTGKIVRIGKYPFAWGAVCAVRKGELYGKNVTLHSPAPPATYKPENDKITVLKNSIVWASFDHPNILPLLGIVREERGIALVSPWMENGTAAAYVRTNPGIDRMKILTEIASGLAYLHSQSPPYVHGLLTGSGVLINGKKQAVVGGFASATFEKGWMTPLRWLAPENINIKSYRLTPASDAYSFAMTALEIMTGTIPFEDVHTPSKVVQLVHSGERPSRPNRKLIHLGLDDKLWSLITRCWAHNPEARPLMSEVVHELEEMRKLPALSVRDLSNLIDFGEGGTNEIRACGAFGDIRMGVLKNGSPVALKTLSIKGKTQSVLRHTKRFIREASIWNDLKHPNILPFLGTADPPGLSTCLVSPWMENGNLVEYIKREPKRSMLSIARGIASGLAYLHAHKPNPVIHGDLRGPNVLISDSGTPLLCDFGLAVILEDLAELPISSLLQDAGNPRWMARELLIGEQQVSMASDVWALGMVLLEITSLEIPFHELKNSAQVIVEVHRGKLPSRPSGEDAECRGMSDNVWALMMKCWAQKPEERPLATDILSILKSLPDTR